jgi:hypothetical protein
LVGKPLLEFLEERSEEEVNEIRAMWNRSMEKHLKRFNKSKDGKKLFKVLIKKQN